MNFEDGNRSRCFPERWPLVFQVGDKYSTQCKSFRPAVAGLPGHFWLPLGICIASPSYSQTIATSNPLSPDDPLATWRPGRPRLLMSDADWGRLRSPQPSSASRPGPGESHSANRSRRPMAALPTAAATRMRDISRQAIERIMLWSVTYHSGFIRRRPLLSERPNGPPGRRVHDKSTGNKPAWPPRLWPAIPRIPASE